VRVLTPIRPCTGLMSPDGAQRVRLHVRLERGSSAELLAHCMCPNAEHARHVMEATVEIGARVFGHATDGIRIRDELVLAGRNPRGLIKTRIAVEEDARSEVIGISRTATPRARGHMDCTGLVRDRAVARAEPIVSVEYPLARVTHEAAVGTVDQKRLETLMAHGLTPQQAVDVIIVGLLR
jgi:Fe-S cluster assembly scaffold protein SufB